MRKRNLVTFIMVMALPLLVGMLSAALSSKGMAAYASMNKVPLSTPAWVFPVAWTILYLLMGLASYKILVSDAENKYMVLLLYLIQLGMNFMWSIIFFGCEMYLMAFVWLILMLGVVILCTIGFWKINRGAGYLLFPYVGWLVFAAYLNMGAVILN